MSDPWGMNDALKPWWMDGSNPWGTLPSNVCWPSNGPFTYIMPGNGPFTYIMPGNGHPQQQQFQIPPIYPTSRHGDSDFSLLGGPQTPQCPGSIRQSSNNGVSSISTGRDGSSVSSLPPGSRPGGSHGASVSHAGSARHTSHSGSARPSRHASSRVDGDIRPEDSASQLPGSVAGRSSAAATSRASRNPDTVVSGATFGSGPLGLHRQQLRGPAPYFNAFRGPRAYDDQGYWG